MRLLATSDLHLGHRPNREALLTMPHRPDDWLIVAGDVGERPEHLVFTLDVLTPRFARVIWVPGNHDLWRPPAGAAGTVGEARYRELVSIARRYGAVTPEDPFVEWPDGSGTVIVPMFLLFDYSFRPSAVSRETAVAWARSSGVVSGDELMLDYAPWPSREAWCHARVAETAARLDELPSETPTILVNHWPLRYDLARPPRVPRFSLWCGTTLTDDWHRRYRARVVISGHLHLRTTLWRDGVRFEEVSLGYPRDWRRDRGVDGYLREIVSNNPSDDSRSVATRDPFLGADGGSNDRARWWT